VVGGIGRPARELSSIVILTGSPLGPLGIKEGLTKPEMNIVSPVMKGIVDILEVSQLVGKSHIH
jgi:hypothetical protein